MIVHSLVVPQQTERAATRLPAKRADKIARILDASLALFAERGFHGTAMPDIAARAEIAPATIYRYFVNKEALVNAVFRGAKERLRWHLLTDLALDDEPRALFAAFFARLVSFARAFPTEFVFLEMQDHVPYLDAESRKLETTVLAPIWMVLHRHREMGVTKPMRPEIVIGMVWGALVGLIKAERLGYLVVSADDLADVERACWDAIVRRGEEGA